MTLSDKLKSLGLTPAAQTKTASSVLSVRRRDVSTGTNYYWLYNKGVDAYAGNNSVYGQNPSNLYEDPDVCHTVAECEGSGYASWWSRQYVLRSLDHGSGPPPIAELVPPLPPPPAPPPAAKSVPAPKPAVQHLKLRPARCRPASAARCKRHRPAKPAAAAPR